MDPSDLDRLSRALPSWNVKPPADPNFRPAVWERIRQSTRDTWTAYLRTHVVGWSVAAAFAVIFAGFTGHSLARARLETNREKMVVSYLSDLDPRVMAKLGTPGK